MERKAKTWSGNTSDFAKQSGSTFKCIVLGEVGVGKTSLLNRFLMDTFTSAPNVTLAVDKVTKSVCLDGGRIVSLELWDTAGQERFHTLTSSYFRHVDAIVFVYDVTNRVSLMKISEWFKEVGLHITDTSRVVKMLVGTKNDLAKEKIVELEEAENLFSNAVHAVDQVSSKSGQNVMEAFTGMCQLLIKLQRSKVSPCLEDTVCISPSKENESAEQKTNACAC